MSEFVVRKEGERYTLSMEKEAFLELISSFTRFSLSVSSEEETSKETARRGRPPKSPAQSQLPETNQDKEQNNGRTLE